MRESTLDTLPDDAARCGKPLLERVPADARSCNCSSQGRNTKRLIVIPSYNEELSLATTIEALRTLSGQYEILVVDDGSTDETRLVAQRLVQDFPLPLHIVSLSANCGIGAAVQCGYLFAVKRGTYQYVVQFDADGQHGAESISDLISSCEEFGLDLCIGSRFLGSDECLTRNAKANCATNDDSEGELLYDAQGYRSTWVRRCGIRFFAWLISRLTGLAVTDPTSGLRCSGEAAYRLFADGYPDDYPEPESLIRANCAGLSIREVPVRMHRRLAGRSSIDAYKSIYYVLKVTLAIVVERFRKH